MEELKKDESWCHYSGMPSPSAYVESDKKLELYNAWEKHIDETSGPDWAGIAFYGWCRVLLCNASVWDEVSDGSFRRADVLDVMLAHASGKIDCNKPYPWEWID